MFEHRHEPLAPIRIFYGRVMRHLMMGIFIMVICLLIGIFGYHYIAEASWIDALHNAAMILSGMGPVIEIKNFWGKIFSSFYALFSGVVFITNIGIILAPAAHRFFHKIHAE